MQMSNKNFQTNSHKFTKTSKPGHYWLSHQGLIWWILFQYRNILTHKSFPFLALMLINYSLTMSLNNFIQVNTYKIFISLSLYFIFLKLYLFIFITLLTFPLFNFCLISYHTPLMNIYAPTIKTNSHCFITDICPATLTF